MAQNQIPKNIEPTVEMILAALRGELSSTQELELKHWLSVSQRNEELFQQLQDPDKRATILQQFVSYETTTALTAVKVQLRAPVRSDNVNRSVGRLKIHRRHWAIAATLLLMFSVSLFYLMRRNQQFNSTIEVASTKAMLKLSNGRMLELKDQNAIVNPNSKTLNYTDGSVIAQGDDAGGEMEFSTPRGAQFNLILEDGTRVALNAGSRLRIPGKFADSKRVVSIEGEAFFEVTHDPSRPFYVKSRGQQIRVLGTSFNVKAYTDEPDGETTLIEGSVQVRIPFTQELVKLKPGQQTILSSDHKIKVQPADIGNVTSWRHGAISLDDKPFTEVMREVSRFYDIDIVYEGPVPDVQLFGGVNHSRNLTTILHLLKASNVPCRLDGRKLIIEKLLHP